MNSQPAHAISFFPWWTVDREMQIGPIRLIPYQRNELPGDLPGVTQSDIDGILAAYSTRPGKRIEGATLIEVDDWHLGSDPGPARNRLFQAREALGFAGLSSRDLFCGHFNYCCFDTFSLVMQLYRPGQPDVFSYSTRRRDGGTGHLWSGSEFAFQRPLHVGGSYDVNRLDGSLVALLMGPDCPSDWVDAVSEFNRANTDASEVSARVELVLTKVAFELLLGIKAEARYFQSAIENLLPTGKPKTLGPIASRWISTYPNSDRLIQAWTREFCGRRGAAAHGNRPVHFVWTEESHLAFASLLFPLVLKRLASESGRLLFGSEDTARLARVDEYISHDPFGWKDDDEDRHPWREIELDIRMEAISEKIYSGLYRSK